MPCSAVYRTKIFIKTSKSNSFGRNNLPTVYCNGRKRVAAGPNGVIKYLIGGIPAHCAKGTGTLVASVQSNNNNKKKKPKDAWPHLLDAAYDVRVRKSI